MNAAKPFVSSKLAMWQISAINNQSPSINVYVLEGSSGDQHRGRVAKINASGTAEMQLKPAPAK